MAKSPANRKIITEFSNITNSLNPDQIDGIKIENDYENDRWENNYYY
jgi:hypothetical protein